MNASAAKDSRKLVKKVKRLFGKDRSGHDFWHLQRVAKTAEWLRRREGGDRKVIFTAAYLHDMHRLVENGENCDDTKKALALAQTIIRKLKLRLTKKQLKKILLCIKHHRETSGNTQPIEVQIIQDADKLDILGFIGIARLFKYAGANHVSIWNPKIALSETVFDELNQDSPSEIHHIHRHILREKSRMNTASAKKIAIERRVRTKHFLHVLLLEISGEDYNAP